jgi:hypothetical protein
MGFEYGAVTRMDVVRGTPAQADAHRYDLSAWIGAVNRLKLSVPVLAEEGIWRVLGGLDSSVLFLEKSSVRGADSVFVCVNKNQAGCVTVDSGLVPAEIRARARRTIQLTGEPIVEEEGLPADYLLEAAEIVLFR